jgi:hypothetical protein
MLNTSPPDPVAAVLAQYWHQRVDKTTGTRTNAMLVSGNDGDWKAVGNDYQTLAAIHIHLRQVASQVVTHSL